MRIGQLAQSVGVDTQTIRFYERQGLLPPPDRQENGYRVYTEKHVERLAFIRRCRILDLSLAEIHELQRYQESYCQIWCMTIRQRSCQIDLPPLFHPETVRCPRPASVGRTP